MPYGRGIGGPARVLISGSNNGIHFTPKMPQCTVHLKVDIDGGIAVHCMQADIGQGSNTLLAAIVAEVLGVDLDRVHIIRVDSDVSPIDLGSYSSRVTFMMGNAARQAAEELRGKLLHAASEPHGAPGGPDRGRSRTFPRPPPPGRLGHVHRGTPQGDGKVGGAHGQRRLQ